MEDDTVWYYIKCTNAIFPFDGIDNNELHSFIQGKKIKFITFSKKTNPNQYILTGCLNDMMNQEEFITLQPIMTIKNSMNTLTKTFTMTQIFYI